jgi:outer membrane protein assembly factor BamB
MALDATTGKPLWNSGNAIGDSIYNAPSVTGGAVYVGSWDGRLYAFGPRAPRWAR